MKNVWNILKNEKIGFHFLLIEFSFFILIIVSKASFTKETYKYVLVGIVLLEIFSFYNLFRMFKILSQQAIQKAEQNLLIKQTKIQNEYILASMQSNKDLNKIRDELLTLVKTKKIGNNEDVREMVNQMIAEHASSIYMHYSANRIIDAILYNKVLLMKKLHIRYGINVVVPEKLGIEDFAIMSVLSNMLDNAIEACSLLEMKDRIIDIDIHIHANFLVIQIENTSDENKTMTPGVSSKEDKENHGLGLLIIENTCKQHQGTYEYKLNKETKKVTCTAILQVNLGE